MGLEDEGDADDRGDADDCGDRGEREKRGDRGDLGERGVLVEGALLLLLLLLLDLRLGVLSLFDVSFGALDRYGVFMFLFPPPVDDSWLLPKPVLMAGLALPKGSGGSLGSCENMTDLLQSRTVYIGCSGFQGV